MGHGEVGPLDGVLPELTPQGALDRLRPRENGKPRGFLVDPMDAEERGEGRGRFPLARPGGFDSNFLSFGQAEGRIGPRRTVDEHLAVFAEASGPGPGDALMMLPHERGERRAGLASGDDMI